MGALGALHSDHYKSIAGSLHEQSVRMLQTNDVRIFSEGILGSHKSFLTKSPPNRANSTVYKA